MPSSVSVIIPAFGTASYIDACLDSLDACKKRDRIRVIVTLDGMKDEILARRLINRPSNFTLISKPNMGSSSSRNAGLSLVFDEAVPLRRVNGRGVKLEIFESKSVESEINKIDSTKNNVLAPPVTICF